jgi:hypothetical protein
MNNKRDLKAGIEAMARVVQEYNKMAEERKKAANLHCPTCGWYCLGKGGLGCIDKPERVEWESKNE